jgi:hypothetical protein
MISQSWIALTIFNLHPANLKCKTSTKENNYQQATTITITSYLYFDTMEKHRSNAAAELFRFMSPDLRNTFTTEKHRSNAAAELFRFMSPDLRNAFFTCYRTYGKVSTKKLISCFQHPSAVEATSKFTSAVENRYDIPDPPSKIFQWQEVHGMSWVREMPVGPGVSPCVNNTCERLLLESSGEGRTINSLYFFQTLCGVATELSLIIRSMNVDIAKLLAEFYDCD